MDKEVTFDKTVSNTLNMLNSTLVIMNDYQNRKGATLECELAINDGLRSVVYEWSQLANTIDEITYSLDEILLRFTQMRVSTRRDKLVEAQVLLSDFMKRKESIENKIKELERKQNDES
jgi:hypothetical protein